jgi:hypothetical protein
LLLFLTPAAAAAAAAAAGSLPYGDLLLLGSLLMRGGPSTPFMLLLRLCWGGV